MEVRKVEGRLLREVIVKIGLERIDTQEEIIVEMLLNSGVTGLVMSSEFTRKQGFPLKKLERPIYVRNMDSSLNKEGPIEYTVEVNIYYQEYRERTEIDVIGVKVDGDLGNTMVGSAQSRNKLEDRRDKDNKMSRGMWKAVETNTGKIGVAETERRRGKGRSRKEMREERREKAKRRKNDRGKKGSKRMGNMG